jgi:hypothetical protein
MMAIIVVDIAAVEIGQETITGELQMKHLVC